MQSQCRILCCTNRRSSKLNRSFRCRGASLQTYREVKNTLSKLRVPVTTAIGQVEWSKSKPNLPFESVAVVRRQVALSGKSRDKREVIYRISAYRSNSKPRQWCLSFQASHHDGITNSPSGRCWPVPFVQRKQASAFIPRFKHLQTSAPHKRFDTALELPHGRLHDFRTSRVPKLCSPHP